MIFFKKIKEKRAQTIMEYTVVLGLVVAILSVMMTMVKRGTQGMIKVVADQVGVQKNSEQDFASGSYMESSSSATQANLDKTTSDLLGATEYLFNDMVSIETTSTANLGSNEQSLP